MTSGSNDSAAGEGRGTAGAETIATAVASWLAQFERALAGPDDVLLEALFHPDSHWRDLLALTWQITTVNGSDAVLDELKRMSATPVRRISGSIPIGLRPAR